MNDLSCTFLNLNHQEEIIQCGRIGFSKDERFKKSFYRYLIYPHLPHREKTNIAIALKKQNGHKQRPLA